MPDNDHRALIEQAHEIEKRWSAYSSVIGHLSPEPMYAIANDGLPLLVRLAEALEAAEAGRLACANQVAIATEAMRAEHASALAFEREQRDLRHHAWLEGSARLATAERERDAAWSALTTVLRGMRSSWWANDHPDWIRAVEDALAAAKEKPAAPRGGVEA